MRTKATSGAECAIDFEDLPHCLLDRSPQPQIALSGSTHVVRYANPAFIRLTGKRATELVGRPFDQAVPECEANRCMDLLRRVYRSGVAETLVDQQHGEAQGACWSYSAWAILSPADVPIGVMVQIADVTAAAAFRRDVTSMNESLLVSAARQHELAESAEAFNAQLRDLNRLLEQRTAEVEHQAQELRQLNAALARTEQRERKRLAEVLHDGMQQVLVAAKLRVEGLRTHVDPEAQKALAQINGLLTMCVDTSRTLAVELFPPALHYGGLIAGLRWLVDEMRSKYGVVVELHAEEDIEPDADELRILIFQAVRELLFNVVKHAEVGTALVTIEREAAGTGATNGLLRVQISDSGKGFDGGGAGPKSGSSTAGGIGLAGVRHRIECQGGTMAVDAAPGEGTHVTLTVPSP